MKKLALFDLDKTIYNTHSFFQLVDYEIEKGRLKKEVGETVQALLQKYKTGEMNYSKTANKLLEVLALNLNGQTFSDLFNDSYEFFLNNKNSFYPYFERTLPILKQSHDVFVVTTNANYVAEAIVKLFDLSGFISSEFEAINGTFSGKVSMSLADGKGLVAYLLQKYGKPGSLAIGDSENDIGMLELVENPICVSPNEELRKYALEKGWKIVSVESAEEELLNLLNF
uniref:HAD family hydrolase n=1 Tax=candidate division WWE3 bacterium TaxID=2053526 RepID=A0A7C4Y2A0_UNCKA